ncbi:MAG: hypothetical protein IID34_14900 [Planctomycetes bacterium]|nr:hypothetical protein [Planctomycetota bacterium]
MNAMSRYVVKVAVGFAVGGIVSALGIMFFPLSLITYPLGGAISGRSLGKGRRPVFGFCVAFVFLGFGIPLLLVAFQGLPSLEQGWPLIIPWFLMYAIAGGIGAAVSGLGWRVALASAAAFGAGGSIAFAAIMLHLSLGIFDTMLLALFVVPVIPHVLGGALLAVALEYPSHKRKKLGLCLQCGYDLRGSKDRCPECGEGFSS